MTPDDFHARMRKVLSDAAGSDALFDLLNQLGMEHPNELADALCLMEHDRQPDAAAMWIGTKVQIIPEEAGMEWAGDPPHYIAAVDWHPKHGVTYTTSETWPPYSYNFHWPPHMLRALGEPKP